MLFRLAMVVKFLLKVVTDTVAEPDEPDDEVVVVDEELLLLQAAARRPPTIIIETKARLLFSFTVNPPNSTVSVLHCTPPGGRYNTMNFL
jgi:hypothetical protein